MKNAENIKKVSLIFFLVLGFIHIFSTLLIANGLSLKYAEITSKLIAIPFALTGILYGLTSLKLIFFPQK